MGSAFTLEEQSLIRTDLKKAARKYLELFGMRKTSVEQLSLEAGISKGAFYKFYETKEHLFFEVLEDLHEEIYIEVAKIFKDPSFSTPLERLEAAMLYTNNILSAPALLNFFKDELPYMFRKLSPSIISAHAHDDSTNIYNLLTNAGIHLNYSPDFISSLVRALISLNREKDIIGQENADSVIQFLIHTACSKLVEDATFTK